MSQTKGRKGDEMYDLTDRHTADKFWSDVSEERRSIQLTSTSTHNTHSTQSRIHSKSSVPIPNQSSTCTQSRIPKILPHTQNHPSSSQSLVRADSPSSHIQKSFLSLPQTSNTSRTSKTRSDFSSNVYKRLSASEQFESDTNRPSLSLGYEDKSFMEQVISTFDKFQAQLDHIDKTLREMKRKDRLPKVRQPPQCIPFITLEDLLNFQHVDEATYDNVVNHFIYLGGLNPIDSAGHYFKCAFAENEEISSLFTWLGTNDKRALKETRFAEACEDAMAGNSNYRNPDKKEFENAMSRALKSMKERRRKHSFNTINRRRRRDDLSDTNDTDQLETHVPIQPIRKSSRLENVSSVRGPNNDKDMDFEYLNEEFLEKNIEEGQDDYTLTASDLAIIDKYNKQKKQTSTN